MRYVLALTLAACGGTAARPPAAVPVAAEVPRHDAATFFDTTAIRGVHFSADGTRILTTLDTTGVLNGYAIPVAGGEPVPLTGSAEHSQQIVGAFPRDPRFLFTVDSGGNELTHVHVMEKDGRSRDLTPGDKTRATFYGFTRDGSAFFITTNERDPRFIDLYRYTANDYTRALVFRNDQALTPAAVSPDGRYLAANRINDNHDSDVLLADLTTGDTRVVTTREGPISAVAITFSADGATLFYASDAESEYAEVWSFELASGRHAPVLRRKWDVSDVFVSDGGRYRAALVNEDGRTTLELVDVPAERTIELRDLPRGNISGIAFDRAEQRLAFLHGSERSPNDLYVMDLPDGTPRRLTTNLTRKIDPAHLPAAEVVRYRGHDGLEIPANLYRPLAPGKHPAVVYIHGGPGGQCRLTWDATLQLLVNHGYVVLAINNRGSSGYGKSFFHLDDRRHGEVDLEDAVAARRYLETLEAVDGKHVAVMGGSYGGYLVAAALAFKPDAFDAGVDIFGVTNWIRTLESIPPWWTTMRARLFGELGDPAKDRAHLEARSPLLHAGKITKPLLVVQGANDPRVLKAESDELVAAVRANQVPVEYLVFDDEGHGFKKKKNQIAAAEKILAFLDRHLR